MLFLVDFDGVDWCSVDFVWRYHSRSNACVLRLESLVLFRVCCLVPAQFWRILRPFRAESMAR